jgi:glycosyltransferase involved in cell wall biosynthesis
MIDELRFDIAHAHNIYGGLTTSVFEVFNRNYIPIVMTLHDYKLLCPNYKLMYRGRICEDCKYSRFFMAIKNYCHKNSLTASAVVAMEGYFNHVFNRYLKYVKTFIAPSKFIKNKFIEFNWPKDSIEYLPNFLFLSTFSPNFKRGGYLLYLGRLSPEKGIISLIKAFMKIKDKRARLMIVGDGPLKRQILKQTKSDKRIKLTGYLSGKILRETTKNSMAVVVPSEWYENAPITILEAFAFGKPVIGSNIGGIPEMIDEGINGYLFNKGDVYDLKEKIEYLLGMNDKQIESMGVAGRTKADENYSSEIHYKKLVEIYNRAIDKVK